MLKTLQKWITGASLLAFMLLPVQNVQALESEPDLWAAWMQTMSAENYTERTSGNIDVTLRDYKEDEGIDIKANVKGLSKIDNSCAYQCKVAGKIDWDMDMKSNYEERPGTIKTKAQIEFILEDAETLYIKLNQLTWNVETTDEEMREIFDSEMENYVLAKGTWFKLNLNDTMALREKISGKMKAMRLLRTETGAEETPVWIDQWAEAIQTRVDEAQANEGKVLIEDLAVITLDTFEEQGLFTADERVLVEDTLDILINTPVTRHYEVKRSNGTSYYSEVLDRQKVVNLVKVLVQQWGEEWNAEVEAEVKKLLKPFSLTFNYDVNDAGYLNYAGLNMSVLPSEELEQYSAFRVLKVDSKYFNFNKTVLPATPSNAVEL